MNIVVRGIIPGDQEAIRRICWQTGYKGKPLAGVRYFDDEKLFTMLFCDGFVTLSPASCFVAELDGKVIGYIIGAPNNAAWERNFVRKYMLKIIARIFFVTWYRYPRSLYTLMFFILHFRNNPSRETFKTDYPAVLHMNVGANQQGGGVGGLLLRTYLEYLDNFGVKGVQLRTTSENEAAIRFYLKNGFFEVARCPGPIWPDGRPAEHVFFARPVGQPKASTTISARAF